MQLLLDSSGNYLVGGLAVDGSVVHECAALSRSSEARDMSAFVGALLDGHPGQEITAIGVGTGPGSFIGTRAAVSFANGFAAASGVPVYPLPSLAACAELAVPCAVLRDARRGEAYLHLPAAGIANVELLALDGLPARLTLASLALIIAEAPLPDDSRGQGWREAVEAAAGGREVRWLPHPTAGGLLRLLPLVEATPFAEPVYLRSFL